MPTNEPIPNAPSGDRPDDASEPAPRDARPSDEEDAAPPAPAKRETDYEVYAHRLRAFRAQRREAEAAEGGDRDRVSADALIAAFSDVVARHARQKARLGQLTYDALLAADALDETRVRRFLSNFSVTDTQHAFVRAAAKLDRAAHAPSFRACMVQRTRRMMRYGRASCPEWMMNRKADGHLLADVLGVPRPWNEGVPIHVRDLAPRHGTALKPPNADRNCGVYLIFSEDRIVDVRRGDTVSGYDTLSKRMRGDVRAGRVPSPIWTVEELMSDSANPGQSAHDWKFFSFYGAIHRIGRIQRHPERAEVWMTGKGRRVEIATPRPEGVIDLPVCEAPPELVEQALRIGLEIPAPFVRIDFMGSDRGFVLGEFTARPGTIYDYSRKEDRRLGDAFVGAEHRLQRDLMAGKRFDAFERFLKARALSPERAGRGTSRRT